MRINSFGHVLHYLILFFISLTLLGQIKGEGHKTGDQLKNSLGIDLVYIEAGSFMMGSPDTEVTRYSNETLHKVTLSKPFFIGTYELTQKQWLSIMTETAQQLNTKRLQEREEAKKKKLPKPVYQKPVMTVRPDKPTDAERAVQKKLRAFGKTQKEIALKEKKDGTNLRFGDNYPMCFLNWNEAISFCRKLTEIEKSKGLIPEGWRYRLPTEAEWEYAARAGTTSPVYNGKQPDFKDEASMTDFSKHAWINPYSTNRIHEVGKLKPNSWGLHDMLGNVAEWCMDIHAPFTNKHQTDPLVTEGEGMLRVYRGLTAHNGPLDIRIARRKIGGPRVPYWTFFGMRLVLAPETEKALNIKSNHRN